MKNHNSKTRYHAEEFNGGYSAAGFCSFDSAPPPPPAPDYTGAAQATAQGNLDAARYQTQANRIDQTNPWGSLNYTNDKTFDADAWNNAAAAWKQGDAPLNRNDFMVDHWTQSTTLNPEIQSALDSQLAIQKGKSDQAASMLQSVKDSYNTSFKAPDLASYMSGVGGVDQSSVGRVGAFTQDPSTNLNTTQGTFNPSAAGSVAQYDPSRADTYSQKAYDSYMALLQPDLDRRQQQTQNQLALQGLAPGTEANYNAQRAFSDSRAAQEDQLAGQAYLQGNDAARADYAAELAGQGQQYGQLAQTFGLNQSAQQAANQAKTQQLANALSSYGANIQGLTTNAQLQAGQNQAQNQAYQQALNKYATQWQQDQTLRNMPLNELNALLTGTQVQNPQFSGYAMQGQTSGPDYSTATGQQSNYLQGLYNAQSAQAASNNSSTAGALGTAAMAAMYFY